MIDLPAGHQTQPVKILGVSAEGMLPLMVARWVKERSQAWAAFVADDELTLEDLLVALPRFLPDHRVLAVPAWDSLPYDRARPSRRVTGTRVASLASLAEAHDQPILVLTTPEALPQRVPPAERVRERLVRLAAGDELDPEWLRATLLAFGYVFDERVDEPGEAAIRAGAVDIHPAGQSAPVRLELDQGRIAAIRLFDPLSQRGTCASGPIRLLPASEAFTVPGETESGQSAQVAERLLPDGPLASLFDFLPGASFGLMQDTEDRIAGWLGLVRDSYMAGLDAVRAGHRAPPSPDELFLTEEEVRVKLARHECTRFIMHAGQKEPALSPAGAVRRAASGLQEGEAVVLCTDSSPHRLRPLFARRLNMAEEEVSLLGAWQDAEALPPGRIGVMQVPLRAGFQLPNRRIIAVRTNGSQDAADADALERLAGALRIGDMVVDPDRGVARLAQLVMEDQAGAPCECLLLEFLAGQRLLLPAFQAGSVWRYGSASTVSPSRIDGVSWLERRAVAERAIETAAVELVQRLRCRARIKAPSIEPNQAYERFVRRMPFAASPDQARAIRSVRDDLVAGRPMHRLVCGDVGFGKTEIALHAAAIVSMSGRQVAVVAPTTILARQHLNTFRRRFRNFGLRIEPLIRGARSSAGKAVLRALEQGKVNILVATHAALAARFHDLGLVIIDEEQRFGEAQKKKLRCLQFGAHSLVMTATPLPRSLQAALLGLVDVSVLTKPPAPRLPVRSIVAPLDAALVRTSLLREARRGGQSFVICPRIEDIAPMGERLRTLVPELSLTVVHGRMAGDILDNAMMKFSSGECDVLLATNIVEAGLDLPNVNTMLIWRADRFGLAQLHQLRGRVGRGRVRAAAYLVTDPDHPPSGTSLKRLQSFVELDNLGAGFEVSVADLDQRGGGNLLGEEQAGHMLLIGTERYRHVLQRALARERGEQVPDDRPPEIVLDLPAYVPADFIPEPDVRLEIYRWLARLKSSGDVEEAREELKDRFGRLPQQLEALLQLTRLRMLCDESGIVAVHAGPTAVALTPKDDRMESFLRLHQARRSKDRVILPIAEASPKVRLQRLLTLLDQSASGVQHYWLGGEGPSCHQRGETSHQHG
jgi:transcription-repair coupling factor (superfamily II helicase)